MGDPKDIVVLDDDDTIHNGEAVIMLDCTRSSRTKVMDTLEPLKASRTRFSSQQAVSDPSELSRSRWQFPRRSNYMVIRPTSFEIVDSPPPDCIRRTRDASVYVLDTDTRSPSVERERASRAVSVATTCTLQGDSADSQIDEPPQRSPSRSSHPHKRRRVQNEILTGEDVECTGKALRLVTADEIKNFIPRASAIVIEDDEFDNGNVKDREGPGEGDLVIDLDEMEDVLFPNIGLQDPVVQDSVPKKHSRSSRQSTVLPLRNPAINPPYVLWKDDLRAQNGDKLRPGVTAEVQAPGELRKEASFLYITAVIKNVFTGQFMLRGHLLLRCRDLNGILSKKCNELVWNIEVDNDDPRDELEQSLSEVPLNNIIGTREVRFTNQMFPACSFRNGNHGFSTQEELDNFAPLVVRWKFVRRYSSARDRYDNRNVESSLEHLREQDVRRFCPHLAVNDLRCREQYRGNSVLGGSHIPGQRTPRVRQSVIVLDENRRSRNNSINLISGAGLRRGRLSTGTNIVRQRIALTTIADNGFNHIDLTVNNSREPATSKVPIRTVIKKGQKYTYGDSFCGGGGATRGAQVAGLEIRWGFDKWATACEGWKLNFPDAEVFQLSADRIVIMGTRGRFDFKVDILHLSPPCQFFSSAHTVAGRDDDMNSASLFAAGPLLDVARPRIATLEQTFGLCSPQFRHFHNSLIREFADRGYSIRWKTVAFANWGLPQRRFRLIMIASCPGERLPTFPPQTHAHPNDIAPDSKLKPWVTVNNVLKTIPANAPNHNPYTVPQYRGSERKEPWSADAILPRCMTTSGGQNYFPDGTREMTCAEYAALQGFPLYHKFPATYIKKIIGNAVPPVISKVLFSWIRQWLENEDGVVRESIVLD